MTATRSQLDIGDALNKLFSDVAWLKQAITNPSVSSVMPSNPSFQSVTLNDGTSSTGLHPAPPLAITNLLAVTGTYYDQIFADVSWSAAATGEPAATFEIELARNMGGGTRNLVDLRRVGGNSVRLSPLQPDTDYSVRVYPINRVGGRGPVSLWADFSTSHDSTVPPAPVVTAMARGATTVVVKFTGLTALQAPDVANGNGIYEIQIDTVNTFNSGNLRTTRSSATIVSFADVTAQGSWYARVSAIDASGNQGPPSAVFGPQLAGGVVDSMILSGLDAAKITFGSMDGDRITANTLEFNTLQGDTALLSKTLEIGSGGQFKIGNPTGGVGTSGIYVNDQGIRLYKDGNPVVTFDALTGTGTFTGTITGSVITGGTFQTSTGGQRFRMTSSPFNGLEMYSGTASSKPGRLIALPWASDTSRPLVRLEGERTAGGSTQPHIDLIGGGIDGYGRIDLYASDIIFGGSIYMRGNVAMENWDLRFRGITDTNHRIRWLAADQLAYDTTVEHNFYTSGAQRAKIAATSYFYSETRFESTYTYFQGSILRLGEVYGNHGLYGVGPGTLRIDSGGGDMRLSTGGTNMLSFTGGYTYLEGRAPVLSNATLYIAGAGDNVHRLYRHTGQDGIYIQSYQFVALYNWLSDSTAQLQNDGNFVLYDDGGAWGLKGTGSSRKIKRDITPLSDGALALVRKLKPVSFKRERIYNVTEKEKAYKDLLAVALPEQPDESEDPVAWQEYLRHQEALSEAKLKWEIAKKRKSKHGKDGTWEREEIGFIAEEVEEVESRLILPATEASPMMLMYQQMTALLCKAIQELSEEVNALKATR